MNQNPVVAAIYTNAIDAAMAMNLLEIEGIKAMVADDLAIGMAWQMSTAMGGVKVLVCEGDLPRAEAILAGMNRSVEHEVSREPDTDAGEGTSTEIYDESSDLETQQTACSDRERLAEACWKGSLISILFLPLQLYVFWMLLRIMSSEAMLRPRFEKLAWWAAAVNIPALFVLAIVMRYWLGF